MTLPTPCDAKSATAGSIPPMEKFVACLGCFVLLGIQIATAQSVGDAMRRSDTVPATQPAVAPPLDMPQTAFQRSVSEFLGHFSAYDPIYFIGGATDPVAKFQFSFKYRLLNAKSPLARKVPLIGGLHFSYTQLSLWQLDKNSAPFYDSNYMPELFYSNEDIPLKIPGVSLLGFQGGFAHDSNGRDGTVSRSINMLWIRPLVTFGDPERFHVSVAPRLFSYIGDLSNNPDIYHFRGYTELRGVVGWRQGLELSAVARAGARWNKGSILLDLTLPLRDILANNFDVYLDAQYFNGYGESLLSYNRRTQAFRVGLALVR